MELCQNFRILLIRIFLFSPSHLPTVTHRPGVLTIHPIFTTPSQLTLLPGSSPALTHPFRLRGKRERKGKGDRAELYNTSSLGTLGRFASGASCLPPCAEGALGRDSVSLPSPSHRARSLQGTIQIPDGILPPEGLPRLFGLLINKLQP